jgi:hypothetical protein
LFVFFFACLFPHNTLPFSHHPSKLLVADGWWRKGEVLSGPVVGQALTEKFIINSVTYHGNSPNNITPAVDNWQCIVGGLLRCGSFAKKNDASWRLVSGR